MVQKYGGSMGTALSIIGTALSVPSLFWRNENQQDERVMEKNTSGSDRE